ncbi:T9SS type A sorting domain-containing protein [Flavobacteriaceae bacterium SZ-1-7]|uniref:T9SS type A sorting domain-containing protein n=1 Tax=Tamlana sedimenti TaxID=3134126 RepID=UPI00312181C8
MRGKVLFKLFTVFASFVLVENTVYAQGVLKEVSLERQINKSSLVVEGKVVAKRSVWNAEQNRILTINTIEVYKSFKGKSNLQIEIVTPGGTIESITQTITPSLKLNINDTGVFTLYDNNIALASHAKSSLKKYKAYSSLQGFYKYDLLNNVATNPFKKSKNISNNLYNQITAITKEPYKELVSFDVAAKSALLADKSSGALAPAITGVEPLTVTAGNGDTITITGSGFGANPGKVEFENADDGGASFVEALTSQILSWDDGTIVVEVPTEAGTGNIRVTDNTSASIVSTEILVVSYALLNYNRAGVAILPQHFGTQGTGMTWQMHTEFDANTAAKESFLRAMETWRCETKINWVLGSATTIKEGVIDDTNVIAFDDATNPLEDGVLGQCRTTTGSCGDTRDLVTELDVIFDNDTEWNYGPDPTGLAFDFETVALHELGHGHQLGHVIDDTGDVMHFSIAAGEDLRFLNSDNATAAGIIQNFSTTSQMCGQTMMTDYSGSCSLGIVTQEVIANEINIYPNPARGMLYIENGSAFNLEKAMLFDIAGRAILSIDMANAPRIKVIDVSTISKGIYFINIFSGNAMVSKKILVE